MLHVTPSGLTSMLTAPPFQNAVREVLLRVVRCAAGDLPFESPADHEWPRLPSDAEAHHLAPLLEWLTRGGQPSAPPGIRTQLRALVLRQTAWHRARTT